MIELLKEQISPAQVFILKRYPNDGCCSSEPSAVPHLRCPVKYTPALSSLLKLNTIS